MKSYKIALPLAVMTIVLMSSYSIEAKICVSNVVCQQQYPWNGKVNIEYDLYDDTDETNIWIMATGKDNKTNKSFIMRSLSGDGADFAASSGKHIITWDANKDYPYLKSEDFSITLTATKLPLYMVIDLSSGPDGANYPISYLSERPKGWTDEYKTTKLVLRRVWPGEFLMGSPEDELGRSSGEDQHQVLITKPFYIGVFEITQKQYELITGEGRYVSGNDKFPAGGVSYNMIRGDELGASWPSNDEVDTDSFLWKLRNKTKKQFDLPTEAQWEYACRAGTTTAWNNGTDITDTSQDPELDKLGRYYYNMNDGRGAGSGYTTVGSYLPNAWDLYDMHGNVWEWCLDFYKSYCKEQQIDPSGSWYPSERVLRGGGYKVQSSRRKRGICPAYYCRSAYRGSKDPEGTGQDYYGFRVALVVDQDEDDQKLFFNFNLTSTSDNKLPVFATTFYGKLSNGEEHLLESMGTISGEGSSGIILGSGKHEICWTPKSKYRDLAQNVEFRVEYEDITSNANYLVLDLNNYKMKTSSRGPMEESSVLLNNSCRSEEIWLRRIEPGTFIMGSPENELGRGSDEQQHQVTLTKPFYLGVFEMTQKQYEIIEGNNPSDIKGDIRPVSNVSYNMIRGSGYGSYWPDGNMVDKYSFLGKLREKSNLLFDLPTEAQWEYACRAGTTNAWNDGSNIKGKEKCTNLNNLGRYAKNHEDAHIKVGSYKPNAWGLYDMHGNVAEWCLDWYEKYGGNTSDPTGPFGGSLRFYRVLRGGGFYNYASRCRSAYRDRGEPSNLNMSETGFRLALIQKDIINKETLKYTINSETNSTLPVFEAKFYAKLKNGKEYLLEDIGILKDEGATSIVIGNGEHTINWYPFDSYTNLLGNIELIVRYEDVTDQAKYIILNLITNKMEISENGPDLSNDKCRTDEIWFRRIEPGTFTIGSPEEELGRSGNSRETQHEVTLSKAYYISVFETTQKQYEHIMGRNPSCYKGDVRPVDVVSYDLIRGSKKGSKWPENSEVDSDSFLGTLRSRVKVKFDLPTEAQWEYACRAGTTTAWNNGTDITDENQDEELNKLGRYQYNKDDKKGGYGEHTKVGSYLPNSWGLYDMHGNVSEWCLDGYRYFENESVIDPLGEKSDDRVLRGGNWDFGSYRSRSAFRDDLRSNSTAYEWQGFRLVIVP